MKKLILLLLLILNSTLSMAMYSDDDSAPLYRTNFSSNKEEISSYEHDADDEPIASQAPSSNEHDELAQLALHTADPNADPFTTMRGRFSIKCRSSRRKKGHFSQTSSSSEQNSDDGSSSGHSIPQKREATYDDVVRIMQFNSRAALSEARLLNREHLDTILAQLASGISSAQEMLSHDAERAITLMADLQTRLAYVEELLPKIQTLLEQDATLVTQYQTIYEQVMKTFNEYTQLTQKNKQEQKKEFTQIKRHLEKIDATLITINRTTQETQKKTYDIATGIASNRLKDLFARYATSALTSVAIVGIMMWFFKAGHIVPDMEINESLHDAL